MLIEDRSPAPESSPESPRRWPKRLLVGGLVTLLLAAVAAFLVSAFALSGSSIEEDPGSLGKVSTDTFGGEVSEVKATAVKSGDAIPVGINNGVIIPKAKLHPGEQVAVEVTVKRPSEIGWLSGGTKTLRQTVTAPTSHLTGRWVTVKSGKNPRVHFSSPVSE